MTSFEYLSSTIESPENILENGANLHWSDYLIISIYFIGILVVGFWVKNG